MKKYTFLLNFGYVEHSRMSFFPFSSENKYATARDALVDLASFLKEQFLLKHKVELKKCCIATKEKDSESEYCSKCGRSIQEEEFDPEAFEEWLSDMACCDVDSFHGEFIDYDESYRWQSDGFEGSPNVRFVYQAEWVMSAAIGHPHRDDVTFDDLCKARTKEKRESFSYY